MLKRYLALFLLCAPLSGCLSLLLGNKMQTNANTQVDTSYNQQVAQARSSYQASKTAPNAVTFAVMVESAYTAGTVGRGQADGPALIIEACGYLDEAAKAYPLQAAKLLAQKGPLYIAANDKATAQVKLEESMKVKPTVYAAQYLLPLYGEKSALDEVLTTCKKTRAVDMLEDEKYLLLDLCMTNTKAQTVETGLAWAPTGDIEYYKKQRAVYAAQAAQRAEEQRQKDAALYASMNNNANDTPNNTSSNNSPSDNRPVAPSVVSVSLRSSCAKTVKVFFGQKPKYGSGKTSSISSNSVSSYSMKPGDMIWVVDDSDNGLSSVTISSSTREVKINSNCTSIN
jgi:hypothetical protein